MTNSSVVGSTLFGIDITGFGDQWSSWIRRLSKRVLLLEFGNNFLQLSESCITPNGIQLNHISRVPLPPEAFDRGVPAEPRKMASLLQEICREKKIRAHRAAVVLQPEVGFQRIVYLPKGLVSNQAHEYVQDSKNGIQIPFPLAQTDFDLSPVILPGIIDQDKDQCPYLLTAIPQLLVDRVVEMLQAADFELQLLELGSLSQLRPMALDLTKLPPHQVDLFLELLPDGSNLSMVTCSGLLAFERLSAIRNLPDLDLDDDQTSAALESGLSAESFIVNDERYLPLSDLDLRVLISDFKRALSRFRELCIGCEIRSLQLTGINSAHPLFVNLLQDSLGLPVQLHRPLLSAGVSGFSLDDVLVQTGLSRLVGLGLGFLSHEQLLSIPANALKTDNNPDNKLSAIRIDQLIADKDASSSAARLSSFPMQSSGSAKQQQLELPSSLSLVQESGDGIELTEVIDVTDEIESSLRLKKERASKSIEDEKKWPTILGEELKEEELISEVKEDEEWPTILGEELKEEELISEVKEDEEWPTILGEELKEEELISEVKEDDEWPTILGEGLKEELISEVKEDDEWPTILGEELREDITSVVEVEKVFRDQTGNEAELLEQQADSGDSLLIIPGLKSDPPATRQKKSSETSSSDSPPISDSLGELRFSDID